MGVLNTLKKVGEGATVGVAIAADPEGVGEAASEAAVEIVPEVGEDMAKGEKNG